MVIAMSAITSFPHRAHQGAAAMSLAEKLKSGERVLPPAVAVIEGVGLVVLGGETRVRAMQLLGDLQLSAYMVRTWTEFAAWMAVDRAQEGVYGRQPFEVTEAGYLYSKAIRALKPIDRDAPRQDVSLYTGYSVRTLGDVSYLIAKAQNVTDPELAQFASAQIHAVAAGAPPSTATDRIHRYLQARTEPLVPLAKQADAVRELAAMLLGVRQGFDRLGGLDLTAIEPKEAEALIARISAGVTTIQRIKRQLKERAS